MDLHAIKDRLEGNWDQLDDKISEGERRGTWLIVLPILVALAGLIWIVRRFVELQPRERETEISLPRPSRSEAPAGTSGTVSSGMDRLSPVHAPAKTNGGAAGVTPKRQQLAEPSDLTRIEGIGPKIAAVLQKAGIRTYRDLANANNPHLTRVLSEAGIPPGLANPATWPEQSSLAAEGRWDELKELQSRLRAGRRK